MKRLLTISIISVLLIGLISASAMAYSDLADKFIRSCYALDSIFPPENWDKMELRDAAFEVLYEIEDGTLDMPITDFCLIAIGSVGDPEDIPDILIYYDDMPCTVIRSLSGFAHPDAINFLLEKTDLKDTPKRELAVLSLSKMDFKNLEKPMIWYNKVRDKLIAVRDKEKVDWLKADIDKIISELKPPQIEAN
ncbi:hypothetical protein J7L05_09860 [bacterium]|nr:hypothetical protein [bacterium]